VAVGNWESNQVRDRTTSSPGHCKVFHHAETAGCPCVVAPSRQVGSIHERPHLAMARTDEGSRMAALDSRKGPAVAPPVRHYCWDERMGMKDPTRSLEKN